MRTMALPRSGCSMTRATGTRTRTQARTRSRLLGGSRRSRRSAKRPASASTMPTFANSEGWRVKPAASGIHERDPLIVAPKGVRTATNPASPAAYTKGPANRSRWRPMRVTAIARAKPIAVFSRCRTRYAVPAVRWVADQTSSAPTRQTPPVATSRARSCPATARRRLSPGRSWRGSLDTPRHPWPSPRAGHRSSRTSGSAGCGPRTRP